MTMTRRMHCQTLATLLTVATVGPAAWAKDQITTRRLKFDKGRSSAHVKGRIQGDDTVDYLVGARAGQFANISLASRHTATYFNILAPGKTDEALFIGSMNGNQFEGVLPATGEYRIRVYMVRAAARRHEVADYRLEVVIESTPGTPRPSVDAKVPGTDFHATGELPCVMADGRAGTCRFGVKRQGLGNGMVVITRPDGGQRTVFFHRGKATGHDASPAGRESFSARRQSDLTIVRIGSERYDIPDAVINGG